MKNTMNFQPSQFTPTKWDTAQDKVRFAQQFVRFVQSDFAAKHFTDRFYRRLSNTFGHIANYNRAGFWEEFFTTTADKVRFLEQTLQHPCYGDPAWTYSDVERALQQWLQGCGSAGAVSAESWPRKPKLRNVRNCSGFSINTSSLRHIAVVYLCRGTKRCTYSKRR